MKRKFTLLLSAVMAASSLPMTAYAANFKDINDVPWAGAATVINSVADKGLLSGYDDGTVRARNNVTYCEAMQMVYTTMTKTGKASFDAATVYSYMAVLDTYKVPKWAQMAVGYGLATGILDMQMVVTNFAGGTKAATREDVAIMFGNAMGNVFGKERDTSALKTFTDYWSISANSAEQVSLLKNMGIISGDDYNRFNPKKNINRAEMAVMLNKTYDALAEGVQVTGEITELKTNKGADGTNYYYIAIKTAEGYKEDFSVAEGQVPVYAGNTNSKLSMARLSVGDDVVAVISGTELISLRQMGVLTGQEKYDVTGYVRSMKGNVVSVDNENTGETVRYDLDGGTTIYVDGEKVAKSELEDILKAHRDEYAYAGLDIDAVREWDRDTEKFEDKIKVVTLNITFEQEYSLIGKVDAMSTNSISLIPEDSSARKQFAYAAGCEFLIGDEEVNFSEAEKLFDDGTAYARVYVDTAGKAKKVVMSEETFANAKETEESKIYTLSSVSDKKLILLDGNERIVYEFGSKNPLEKIQFYTWDAYNEEWDDVKQPKAEAYSLEDEYTNDKGEKRDVDGIYCKIVFNAGGKLREVYLSTERNAWKNSDIHESERAGVVASIKNDVLKFTTSSVAYKLLRSYDEDSLLNKSMKAQSKNVLERMANDSNVELYAEIKANGDNEITEITTRVKHAEGELVEFNTAEKYFEIKTDDGNTFKFVSLRRPTLVGEIEDVFELEDIEDSNSRYIGSNVILEFNGTGSVNKVTVESELKTNDVTNKISGIAVAAYDGLKLKGDSTTYRWNSKTDKITITNHSGSRSSLGTIKDLIEDPDVEVYVEALLDDYPGGEAIDVINVYVRAAEGTLKKYADSTVRIQTDAGNTFTFNCKNKLTTCDVNGYGQKDLDDTGKGVGAYVALTFGKDGVVTGIENK